jgi:hypothetical protein
MNTVSSVRLLQAIAVTVGTALLLWSIGIPTFFRTAEAASITSASDTLSSSVPGAVSNHTITFTTPNGIAASETIELTFDATFDMTQILFSDVDIASSTEGVIADGASGAGTWGFATTTNTITLEAPTDNVAASSTTYTIQIGTNAAGPGVNQVINPTSTTTSHKIVVGGTMPDSGQVRIAVIDEVVVSAAVDTSLTFTVSGVIDGQTLNGSSPTTTVATSTPTTLPFGTLPIGTSVTLAQDLAVSTNAANGYVVTVEQAGQLQSTTGDDIDGFIDGAWTDTPTGWTSPGNLVTDENTYGHWGLTSNDGTTTRPSGEFGTDEYVAASSTPTIIMGHSGVADGVTAGIGAARIGFQVQITALQEAGNDYSTELRYIATPTF